MTWIDRATEAIMDAYEGRDLNPEFIANVIRNNFNQHINEALRMGEDDISAMIQDFEID